MPLFARLSAVLMVAGTLLLLPLQPAEAATTKIQVGTYWFCSSSYASGTCPTTVAVGDSVTWNFPTDMYHTSTACGASCDTPSGGMWDSGLRLGGSYTFTFNQAGVYPYQCTVHTTLMRGQITVVSPVGGIAALPDVEAAPLVRPESSSSSTALFAGLGAAAVGVMALAGAAWRRRRPFSQAKARTTVEGASQGRRKR